MIDFHTHILPEIDDGSLSGEMSVKMLKMLKEQGVNKVLLTPHFYAYSSSAENFMERRAESVSILLQALEKEPVDIQLYLGCEVLYFDELWRLEDLKSFCIKGTECILVEMPFGRWTDTMVRGIEKIIGKGLTPIIAHFERYLSYRGNLQKIYELVEMGALLQMNCAFVNKLLTRGKALKFFKIGIVCALGTDCHNLENRAPDFKSAAEYIEKKLAKNQWRRLVSMQKSLLDGAEMIYSAKEK